MSLSSTSPSKSANNSNGDSSSLDDAFLTTLEAKLKPPFSSLELAKIATTPALRNTPSTLDYLTKVRQVLPHTSKIIRNRILVGLLGAFSSSVEVDDDDDDALIDAVDECRLAILRDAQEAPLHEEWVRVLAGLVQNILFRTDEEEDGNEGMDEGLNNGQEAKDLLSKTCASILGQVIDQRERKNQLASAEDGNNDEKLQRRLAVTADADSTLCPYRYALLSRSTAFIEEDERNNSLHFDIDQSAPMLNMDAQLELVKAQEEHDHNLNKNSNNGNRKMADGKAGAADQNLPIMPGVRAPSTSGKKKPAVQRPKSSMFMPRKSGVSGRGGRGSVAGRSGRGSGRGLGKLGIPIRKQPLSAPTKTALHVRKKGASQALVGKAKTIQASSSSTPGDVRRVHATSKGAANGSSKMKMVEVSQVHTEQQKTAAASSLISAKRGPKKGLKRKADLMAAAVAASNKTTKSAARKKSSHTDSTAPSANQEKPAPKTENAVGALAAGALAAYQAMQQQQQQQQTPAAAAPAPPVPAKQLDWRELLRVKSNKLTNVDVSRIQQFFVNRTNPDGANAQSNVKHKIKLHEERLRDPETGKDIKDTYYLELDYSNFTSQQSKKRKRYD